MNEARKIESDVIDYLVDRKFKRAGDAPFPSLEQWREGRAGTLDRFFSESEDEATYRAELEQMSLPALKERLAQVMEQEAIDKRQRAELEDRARFFNEESAQADFEYWSKMPRWTLDEATTLSLGKAPMVVDWENVKAYLGRSPFAEEYSRLRSLLHRANAAGDLHDPTSPAEFIRWAERTGIDLPRQLLDAVRAAAGRIEDWRSLTVERDELRERVSRLQQEAAKEKPLSTRERQTLLKIVLGQAIKGYAYKPDQSRNVAPREIADDLASLGIPIDEDTVRKWLRIADDEVERSADTIETRER
jgi:hypothetical protein